MMLVVAWALAVVGWALSGACGLRKGQGHEAPPGWHLYSLSALFAAILVARFA
jgi:hypothetical protein